MKYVALVLTLSAICRPASAVCSGPALISMGSGSVPLAGEIIDMVAVDTTRDGLDDLVVLVRGTNQDALVTLRALGNGSFDAGSPAVLTPLVERTNAIAAAQLDSDGQPDIVAATAHGVRNYFGYTVGGAGFGMSPTVLMSNLEVKDVAVADWDRDGNMDIVASFADTYVRVFRAKDRLGRFDTTPFEQGFFAGIMTHIAAGDIMGNGLPSVIASSATANAAQYMRDFAGAHTVVNFASYAAPGKVAIADLDLDANQDVAIAYPGTRTIRFWRSRYAPPGVFAPTDLLTELPAFDLRSRTGNTASTLDDFVITEINKDGYPDLVVSDRGAARLWLFPGTTSGFGAPTELAFGSTYVNGPSPATIAVGRFTTFANPDVAVAHRVHRKVAVFSNGCSPSGVNVVAAGLEVTQAIQDLASTVRLFAGRRTFVRGYATSSSTSAALTATLSATNNVTGQRFARVLRPLNAGLTSTPTRNVERHSIDSGFLFELPPEWTVAGDLALDFEVNGDHRVVETTYADNVRSDVVHFVEMPPVKIEWVDWGGLNSRGVEIITDGSGIPSFESALRREYPASRFVFSRSVFHSGRTVSSRPDASEVSGHISDYRARTASSRSAEKKYVLLIAQDTVSAAEPNTTDIVGLNHAGNGNLVLHEIGHIMGRKHAPCGASNELDLSYPFPHGGTAGPNLLLPAYAGFDAGDASLTPSRPRLAVWPTNGLTQADVDSNDPRRITPHIVGDIMSYCGTRWISSYTYEAIADHILATMPMQDPLGDFLAINGRIDTAKKTATLDALRVDQASYLPKLSDGGYVVRLRNAKNTVLAVHPFAPSPGASEVAESIPFYIVIPFVGGTRVIEIATAKGVVLASRSVTANAPKVDARLADGKFGSGPIAITWDASDRDGDALNADVLYSSDKGDTWRVVLANATTSPIVFDSSALPSTHNEPTGLLRVRVTDGVLTGSSTIANLITLGREPSIRIINPFRGSTFAQGQSLVLAAAASDNEGTPDGSTITWSSNRDGILGTGATIAPYLSQGLHTITAVVRDSDGLMASASTTITMARALPAGSKPVAYAGPDVATAVGKTITLDASKSRGSNDEQARLFWQVISAPPSELDEPLQIVQTDPRFANVTPRVAGTYVLRVYASTSWGTTTDDVTLTVNSK